MTWIVTMILFFDSFHPCGYNSTLRINQSVFVNKQDAVDYIKQNKNIYKISSLDSCNVDTENCKEKRKKAIDNLLK
jgi:hypothetical protein